MNKYQKQANPANHQVSKKPAHLKKNPLAHAIWLAAKKERNQKQYQEKRKGDSRA